MATHATLKVTNGGSRSLGDAVAPREWNPWSLKKCVEAWNDRVRKSHPLKYNFKNINMEKKRQGRRNGVVPV